ncbi:MAG: hypothetical protein R3E01_22580 [Pirellulaceae bacterium]|nr:hypothetical protein [Planctomycetales bacterium]
MISRAHCNENQYIQALQHVLEEPNGGAKTLIIAHCDRRMIDSLTCALETQGALLLEIPQARWDFSSPEFADAMEWLLNRWPVESVILAGHSQAGWHAIRGRWIGTSDVEKREAASGYQRSIRGVQHLVAQTQEAQTQFAEHLRQMMQVPPLCHSLADRNMAVFGLLYRAEDGEFLSYTWQL